MAFYHFHLNFHLRKTMKVGDPAAAKSLCLFWVFLTSLLLTHLRAWHNHVTDAQLYSDFRLCNKTMSHMQSHSDTQYSLQRVGQYFFNLYFQWRSIRLISSTYFSEDLRHSKIMLIYLIQSLDADPHFICLRKRLFKKPSPHFKAMFLWLAAPLKQKN